MQHLIHDRFADRFVSGWESALSIIDIGCELALLSAGGAMTLVDAVLE